jgi:hypothetical protein
VTPNQIAGIAFSLFLLVGLIAGGLWEWFDKRGT